MIEISCLSSIFSSFYCSSVASAYKLNIPAKINRHSGMAETAKPEYWKPL